ncbi:MAG: SDR family oxidoreductase [Candidatus Marsarchaeota archaeon]|nr:SDR family oxidoreductase [Candidatus Marsarchaeota archaeon]
MASKVRSAIIISASSDIGAAMGHRWLGYGWSVFGTYRSRSQAICDLDDHGAKLAYCDLSSTACISDACSALKELCEKWDALVLCPGTLSPVGRFMDSGFSEWAQSVEVNFTSQMHVIHELLPSRRVDSDPGPCVLMFAGGGTNDAPIGCSAYTVSKIALIKMCELLSAEIPDTRFVIVGPGWVKTKIHEPTLRAGEHAGANYRRTIEKLAGDQCTPMDYVLDCCDWLINAPREVISGRNFSVVFDKWGTRDLEEALLQDPNMYKLRRHGNDRLNRNERG